MTRRGLIASAALLMVASIGLAAPASAATAPNATPPGSPAGNTAEARCADDFAYPGINIRALPNTNGAIRGQGNPGDCLTYHKVMTGEYTFCPELGVWGDQWYDVTNNATGVRGWILGCYVT